MKEMPADLEASPQCPHGLPSVAECAQCKFEAQPSWQTVRRLRAQSKFQRSNESSPNCTIEREGRKFKVEVIESGKDAKLSDVQKFFEETFGEEEVDSEEILRSAVDGVTPWGTEDTRYRIVTIWDENSKLIAVATGAPLEMLDEKMKPTGKATYFVGYAVTDPSARQGGLAREAYISALMDATREAQSRGLTLDFAIGECTHTSEKFWNSVGWKRAYRQTGEKEYTELDYVQPALEFDGDTGAIAEGAGEMPEHLMVDSFGPRTPSKEDVKQAYDAMFYFNADWPEEAFSNRKAYKHQKRYIQSVKKAFRSSIDRDGQLIFLDAASREKAREKGLVINDYVAADRAAAGEEDF